MKRLKRLTKRLAVRLRHHLNEHLTDCNLYVHQITYGYNTYAYLTTLTSLSSLILSRESPRALDSEVTTAEEVCRISPAQAKLKVNEQFLRLRAGADKASHTTWESYARHFNRRVHHWPVCRPRDLIFIDKPHTLKASEADKAEKHFSMMLAVKKDGPYLVIKVTSRY